MSTRTKVRTSAQNVTDTDDDAHEILHVWYQADVDFSNQTGIEVRSLCGCWGLPGEDEGGPLEGNAFPRPVRLCKRCTRTRAYRQ